MARKKGTKVKTAVKKILDKTEKKSLYDTIFCHVKCYGGYVLAVGAGCMFGVNIWWGLGLTVAAGLWGWKVNCACKPCKGGSCK